MQFSLATLTTLLAFVSAAPAQKGFVHAPLQKTSVEHVKSLIPNFAAQGPVTAELYNQLMSYQVSIALGGQTIKASIDTGSEILWVWDSNSDACQVDQSDCAQQGSYTPGQTASSNNTGEHFNIQYGKGNAAGDLYTDTAVIGGATVPKFKFGVNEGEESAGGFTMVFGIGWNPDSTTSISAKLKEAGAISRQLYGMSFSKAFGTSSDNSEITFGAINTGRYSGSLKTVPRVDTGEKLQHFTVTASGKFGDTDLFDDDIVILDSGTTMTYLKSDNYNNFLGALQDADITLTDYEGGWQGYPCSQNSDISFTYNFSGKEITVSGEAQSLPGHTIDPNVDESICFIGIGDGGNMNLFGDTFLKSVYTVYDLERNEISIAQAATGKPDNYQVITGNVPN